jgi:hypothetical protein
MDPPPPITLNDLAQSLHQIILAQQDFRQDLTAINTEITHLQTRLPPTGLPPPPPPVHGFAGTAIKLEIPRFDGADALGWIFKINQFFEFHRTPEDQRLNIASFYMEGEALSWYQWMHSNGSLHSWPAFLHALEMRFAPSQYEDPKGALFKLCQTTTVREYQKDFESLANRITELPPQFYLSCRKTKSMTDLTFPLIAALMLHLVLLDHHHARPSLPPQITKLLKIPSHKLPLPQTPIHH